MSWAAGYNNSVEYTTGYYQEQSPTWLKAALVMQRVAPPAEGKFSYCELGFGQGLTSLILAATHPQGEFYACDFNPLHVIAASSIRDDAQLPNLTLLENSFGELADGRVDLPMFDFVTLHGIGTERPVAEIIADFFREDRILDRIDHFRLFVREPRHRRHLHVTRAARIHELGVGEFVRHVGEVERRPLLVHVLVHEVALVGRIERLHARGRVGIALEVQRVRVEQLPRECRRAREAFALVAGVQRQQALQRLDLRTGGHRVVADLHDAARLQIAREKAHDLRARFVRHP